MPAPSRKPSVSAPPPDSVRRLAPRDGAILAVVLGVALIMMAQSGFERGVDLMPWPDGLEYAAMAVNLDRGRGAVLHFGGYSYPSRYTEGYPLILAAAWPLIGRNVARLFDTTVVLGLLALIALYVLTFELFDRASAALATLLLAVSPIFVTYSTLVLSDVPTLAVTILAALALARATSAENSSAAERASQIAYWAIFGFLAGFTVVIRPSNATILIGVIAGLIAARPPRIRPTLAPLIAFAIGFAPMPLWQARENLVHFGSVIASGYAWWVPEVYGVFSRTFNAGYLFGATMPRNPHGNLPVYLLTLCGLDGLLNSPGAPRFYLYPFGAAVFAAVALVSVIRSSANRAARRVIFFGLGFLAALVALYIFYVFTEVAFILPGCFVVFALAGYGATLSNRRLGMLWRMRRRATRESALIAAVAILDLLAVVPVGGEISNRFSVTPRESEVVPALRTLDSHIAPGAVVVSNISLQFLELYEPAPGRSFVGLHSFDPGEKFTDYHLGRLYVKQSRGWRGPVPPALFDATGIIAQTADSIASRAKTGQPLYLLLWIPDSREYADILKDELSKLGDRFMIDEVARAGPLVLYELQAK